MSDLQDWTRTRNLEKGRIVGTINQLKMCNTLTYREKELADLCIGYLEGLISRWEICNETSKRECLSKCNKGEKS